ncbi:MAG TPA: hypothetical protein VFS09_10870 [Candidatus Eisenbacteria bacterium]|nr:hypothetical protein [Candidatus Eisenbacteria bacterium]
MPELTRAGDLYNAGSEALANGNLGEAVLFLRAASRLEPRAKDVARNVSIAEARVALTRGEGPTRLSGGGGFGLSSGEAWLLAALLIALGAAGLAWRRRRLARIAVSAAGSDALRDPRSLLASRVLDAAGIAGFALSAWLAAGAVMERVAPEAVVLDRSLPLTAASGQPLPEAPALVAGERVRLGAEREGLVEIRLGGTNVGWARRSGVWRVVDASRYTLPSSTDGNVRPGRTNG